MKLFNRFDEYEKIANGLVALLRSRPLSFSRRTLLQEYQSAPGAHASDTIVEKVLRRLIVVCQLYYIIGG